MPASRYPTGRSLRGDDPDWAPLEALLGLDLVGAFMWMFELELEDGVRVHSYKHIATRCYIHLAVDGRTFVYVPPSRYREIPPAQAIELAFAGWEELCPQPRRPAVVRAALADAIDRAVSG